LGRRSALFEPPKTALQPKSSRGPGTSHKCHALSQRPHFDEQSGYRDPPSLNAKPLGALIALYDKETDGLTPS